MLKWNLLGLRFFGSLTGAALLFASSGCLMAQEEESGWTQGEPDQLGDAPSAFTRVREDNDCSVNPCHNGGTCTQEESGTSCACPIGYAGAHCEIAAKISPVKIATGYRHTLAVKSGTVWSWGSNGSGQLGDGTSTNVRLAPVKVIKLSGVVAVAAGVDHSLALKSDGTVWSWGWNGCGQVGNGTMGGSYNWPQKVKDLTGVVAVAAGEDHSLALKSDGTVWAWGCGEYGELGDGAFWSETPAQVPNLSGIVNITAGRRNSLAVKKDGSLWKWGGRYYMAGPSPVEEVLDISSVKRADVSSHRLMVKYNGEVWAWGYNGNGQLGDGTWVTTIEPVQVENLMSPVAIAAGDSYSLAVTSDGSLWAWGYNGLGQLGNGTTINSNLPVQVPGLSGVVAAAASSEFSVALKSDGTIWAWGDNGTGQLGNGTYTLSYTPVQVKGLTL